MLNIIAPINQLGYGQVGTHLVVELMKDVEVSLFPIGDRIDAQHQYSDTLKRAVINAEFYDVNDHCIRVWHQFDLAKFVGRGEHIGFPIFELNKFTKRETHHLNQCDRLFVCSEWARNVVKSGGIGSTVNVIPLGVDLDIFKPKISKRQDTIFFTAGKLEKRKGHKEVVDAFNTAFNNDDNVQLWMMIDNPFLPNMKIDDWKSHVRSSKLGDKITFIPYQPTQTDVARVMQQTDCGIFLSRAEGWNLEALEMLACGKEIIITNYSGHTQFCTEENSHLIDIDLMEVAKDGIWFNGQGEWATLGRSQMEDTVEKMRKIHLDKRENGGIMNHDGVSTANEFTWNNMATTILNTLRRK